MPSLAVIRERGYFLLPEVVDYTGYSAASLRNMKSAQKGFMAHAFNGVGGRICVPVQPVEAFIEEEKRKAALAA